MIGCVDTNKSSRNIKIMIRKNADSYRSNPEVIIVTHPSVVIENNDEFDVQDNMTFDPTFGDDSIIKKN